MAKDAEEFNFDSLQDTESIVKYLHSLADGFASGRLTFRSGERDIVLEPRGLLKFEIEAQRKGHRSKVMLKFAWKQEDPGKASGSGLVITSKPTG